MGATPFCKERCEARNLRGRGFESVEVVSYGFSIRAKLGHRCHSGRKVDLVVDFLDGIGSFHCWCSGIQKAHEAASGSEVAHRLAGDLVWPIVVCLVCNFAAMSANSLNGKPSRDGS